MTRRSGVGMRTRRSISTARSSAAPRPSPLVQAQAGDLLADGEHRVEARVIGSWKMIAISRADLVHLSAPAAPGRGPPQHLAGDDPARRHVGISFITVLAVTRSCRSPIADHADGLAGVDREVTPSTACSQPSSVLKRVFRPLISSSGTTGPSDLRGSSASRSPSPMKLIVSTVTKIAMPGNSAQCGAMSRQSARRRGCGPRSGCRAESPGRGTTACSAMIAAATSMVAATITGPSALGRMCAPPGAARSPSARAASTNSFSRRREELRAHQPRRRHPAEAADHDDDQDEDADLGPDVLQRVAEQEDQDQQQHRQLRQRKGTGR